MPQEHGRHLALETTTSTLLQKARTMALKAESQMLNLTKATTHKFSRPYAFHRRALLQKRMAKLMVSIV